MRKRLKSAARKLISRRMALFTWRWREAFVAAGLFGVLSLLPSAAQALNVTAVTLSGTNVTYEQGGLPNGTTVTVTVDAPGQVQIAIAGGIQNFGDAGTQVASLTLPFTAAQVGTPQSIFWNGLWLINGALGRIDGLYQFTATLSTTSASSPVFTATPLVSLNSVDIHSVSVTPSFDSNGLATFPYTIGYALAKQANVSITISSGTTLERTLLSNKLQVAETVSTQTVTWDGTGNNGQLVPPGNYTVTINATDPLITNSSALPATQTISVGSLSGAGLDPKTLFDTSAFVYPNPIRDGQGIFQFQAVRDGATITLRIYTITGTLVLDKNFGSVPTGVIQNFPWPTTNQSGNKVGRGLYFYVMRENDPQGVIEITKKLAVIR